MIKKKGTKDEIVQNEKEDSVFEEAHTEKKKLKVEVEDVTDTEPAMPISAVEKLLKSTEERLMNIFNTRLQALKLDGAKSELENSAKYIAELEEDWMESPALFFAYSINYSIFGDNKRGKLSEPPSGPVKFKPIIRSKRQTRRGEEVISVSSVKVQSRALYNWLISHSQFGIAFYENMESALNIDSGWAQKLIEANQSIQQLSDQQVIARSRQENLPIGTDTVEMRKLLVSKLAERTISKQDTVLYDSIRKSTVEKETSRAVIEKTIPQQS